MELRGKKTLVTGAGGFVGSHLVERLIEQGCTVRCLIRYNSRNDAGLLNDISPEKRAALEIIAGDLRDPDCVSKAVRGTDIVWHLGALIAIPYSYVHPREVAEVNLLGTLNVMTAARDCGVGKVVHTSTSEVYGTALRVPIDEGHPLQGQSPYSASKIGADKIAESFYHSFSLPVSTIRPFNVYGPRQSGRAVIPTIITQALTQQEIFLGDLRPTRDFTFVKDTVEAFIQIAESDEAVGRVFNVGSGYEISIGEIAEKIAVLIGKRIRIIRDEERIRPEKSEVRRLLADSTLALKTFGWKPRVQLEDGLRDTIRWIAENMNRYKTGSYTY